jgi:HSP20 family protein
MTPMASDRWDPFREGVSLRDAVNSLLQESFVGPWIGGGAGGAAGAAVAPLPLDVVETPNEFIVRASLPGVRPEDVDITVHGETLTIRAVSRPDEERQGQTWHLRERRFGIAQRSLALSAPIDSERADARFDHGVLTLTLPKSEQAKPKHIKIGTGPG